MANKKKSNNTRSNGKPFTPSQSGSTLANILDGRIDDIIDAIKYDSSNSVKTKQTIVKGNINPGVRDKMNVVYLSSMANSLLAIAGLLYARKNISLQSAFNQYKSFITEGKSNSLQQLMISGKANSNVSNNSVDLSTTNNYLKDILDAILDNPSQVVYQGKNGSNKVSKIIFDGNPDIISKLEILFTNKNVNFAAFKEFNAENVKQFFDSVEELSSMSINTKGIKLDWITPELMKTLKKLETVMILTSNIVKSTSKSVIYYTLIYTFKDIIKEGINSLIDIVSSVHQVYDTIVVAKTAGVDFRTINGFFTSVDSLVRIIVKMSKKFGKLDKAARLITNNANKLKDIAQSIANTGITKAESQNIVIFANYISGLTETAVKFGLLGLLLVPLTLALPAIKLLTLCISAINSIPDVLADNNKKYINAKKDSDNMMQLILGVSSIMLVGALIGKFVFKNIGSILGFGLVLGLFLIETVTALSAAQLLSRLVLGIKKTKDVDAALEPFAKLVLYSGLILLGGSLTMKFIDPKNLTRFTVTLGLFLSGIVLAYGLAANMAKGSLDAAEKFKKLIVASSAILLIGALAIHFIPWLPKDALEFTGLLFVFVGSISVIVGVASRIAGKNGYKAMIAIGAIILVSTVVLLVASMFVENHPNFINNTINFTIGMALLVGAAGGLAILASKFGNHIVKGVIFMGILIGLIALAGIAMGVVAKAMTAFGTPGKAIGYLLVFAGAMVIMSAIMIGIGALVTACLPLAPILAIGAGVLAGISGIILLMASAFLQINKVISTGGVNTDTINKMLDAYGDIAKHIIIDIAPIILQPKAMKSLRKMRRATRMISTMVSDIAKSLSSMATLKFDEYDDNGNKIGTATLSTADISNASKNITITITTLFDAIKDVYSKNPDMFNGADEPFSIAKIITNGGKTPYDKVIIAATRMGTMISSIASGIAAMAKMTFIEYDDNGNSRTVSLNKYDFTTAATNIGTVITTLFTELGNIYSIPEVKAIVDEIRTYDYAAGTYNGSSPALMMISAGVSMGNMLSALAGGIKDIANMTFVEYKEDGSYIIRNLSAADIAKYRESIYTVLDTIFGSLVDFSMENPTIATLLSDSNSYYTKLTDNVNAVSNNIVSMLKNFDNMRNIVNSLFAEGNTFDKESFKQRLSDIIESFNITLPDFDGKTDKNNARKNIRNDKNYLKTVINEVNKVNELIGIYNKVINSHHDLYNALSNTQVTYNDNTKISDKLIKVINSIYINDIDKSLTINDTNEFNSIKESVIKNIGIYSDIIDSINSIPGIKSEGFFGKLFNVDKESDIQKVINIITSLSSISVPNDLDASILNKMNNVILSYNNMVDNINNIKKIANKNVSIDLSIFNRIFESLSGFNPSLFNEIKLNRSINSLLKYRELLVQYDAIAQSIATINSYENANTTALDDINDSIYKSINREYTDSKINQYKKGVNATRDLVKSVNTVDLNKVNGMASLAGAVSQLLDKMPDIDKLSSIVSDQLASTLTQLSEQLAYAAQVFSVSDNTQKTRLETVNKLTKEIKEMMNSELTVNINSPKPNGEPYNQDRQEDNSGYIGGGLSDIPSNNDIAQAQSEQQAPQQGWSPYSVSNFAETPISTNYTYGKSKSIEKRNG